MRRVAPLLLLLIGCSGPTELVLVIDSNLVIPQEIDLVEVVITGPDGLETRASQPLDDPDSPAFPLTLGLTPEDADLGPLSVSALGIVDDRVVLRQDAVVTLEAGRSKALRLLLLRSCVGRECTGGTCSEDGCVAIDREDLDDWTGAVEPIPDDPCLALPFDADADGEPSSMCGGADCDDEDPAVFPGIIEACSDGVDNNCDGVIDEGCTGCTDGMTEPCMTSCGGIGQRRCVGDAWGSCAAAGDPCNYLDDDCDGFTDEGQSYVAASEHAIVAGQLVAGHPHLVWADDRYAVAWDQTDELDGDPGVYARHFDRDGAPLAAFLLVHDIGESPRLAWSGAELGMVWIGCASDETCTGVRFSPLEPDLSAARRAEQLDNNNDGDPRPRVAWDGTSFVTISYDRPNVELSWLSPAGALEQQRQQSSANPTRPDMTAAAGQLRIAYTSGDSMSFVDANRLGFPAGGTTIGMGTRPMRPTIVAADMGHLIAWLDDGPGGARVELAALDAAGAIVGGPTTLGARAPSGPDPGDAEVAMANAPGQVLVSWLIETPTGDAPAFARLTLDGQIIQAPTPVAAVASDAAHVSTAWSGAGFGTVWATGAGGRRQIRFANLVCPAASP